MSESTGAPQTRCSRCGDVLMYCTCVMDFIDSLPDRGEADEPLGDE